MEPPLALPDEQRCVRSDGKSWRCRNRRMEGKSLCEAHNRQIMARMDKYKTLALARHKNKATIRVRVAKGKKSSDSISDFLARLRDGSVRRKQTGENLRMVVSCNKSLCCHQCHRNDKGRVVECSTCRRKKYCIPCITRWYPRLYEAGCAKSCPSCRKICNCKSCLRMKWMAEPLQTNIKVADRLRYSCYMICMLLPLVKKLCELQAVEKEINAKIHGVQPTEMKLQQAICHSNEHMYCNNCKSSILDLHRRCTNCSYILCINCCRRLREGCLLGCSTVAVQYNDRGNAYLHGGAPCIIRGQESSLHKHVNFFTNCHMHLKDWKANSNGSIPCPSKKIGGCGESLLELVCMFPDNWLSELEAKAETFAGRFGIIELPDFSTRCSCLNPSELTESSQKMLRKAAFREESDDNYLYSPIAGEIQEGELEHFQRHWFKGEPVIVRDVIDITSGLSWEPMVIWRALRERTKMKAESDLFLGRTINCLDWCEAGMNIYKFFRGYTKGCAYKNQWPMMLKLKDWPPAKYLMERLKRHCDVFINTLPYQEYTDPRSGFFNIAVNMRGNSFKLDLGPKPYFAYGLEDELGRGDSVTKLHSHVFDVVNVLTHVAKVDLSSHQISEIKKLKRRHRDQDIREDLHRGKRSFGTNMDDDEMYSHNPFNMVDEAQAKASAVPDSTSIMHGTASDGQFLLSETSMEETGDLEKSDMRKIQSRLKKERSNNDTEAVAEVNATNEECGGTYNFLTIETEESGGADRHGCTGELPVFPTRPVDEENAKNGFKQKRSIKSIDLESELGEKDEQTEEWTNEEVHVSVLEAENRNCCLSGVALNCGACISCLIDTEAINFRVKCNVKAKKKRKIVEHVSDIGGPPGFSKKMGRVVNDVAFGKLQNKDARNNFYVQTNECGDINVIEFQRKNDMISCDTHIKVEICEEMHEIVHSNHGQIHSSVVEASNLTKNCDTGNIPICREIIDEVSEVDVVNAGAILQKERLGGDSGYTEIGEVGRTQESNNDDVYPCVVKTEAVTGFSIIKTENSEAHFDGDQLKREKILGSVKNHKNEMRNPPGFIKKLGKVLDNAVSSEVQIKKASSYFCLGSESKRSEDQQGNIENKIILTSVTNKMNNVEKRASLSNLGLGNIVGEETVGCNDSSTDSGKRVKKRSAGEKMKRRKHEYFGSKLKAKPCSLGIINKELVEVDGIQNLPDSCFPGLSVITASTTNIENHNQSIVYCNHSLLDKVGTDLEKQTDGINDDPAYLVECVRRKFCGKNKTRRSDVYGGSCSGSVTNDTTKFENQNDFSGCYNLSLLDKVGSDAENQTDGHNVSEYIAECVKGIKIGGRTKKMGKSATCGGNLKRKLHFGVETENNDYTNGNSTKECTISMPQETRALDNELLDVENDASGSHFYLSPVSHDDSSKDINIGSERIDIGCRSKKKEKNRIISQHKTDSERSQGGVLWDIFRREDAMKLQEYLKKHSREFRHIHCALIEEVVHPIHDQVFYLTSEHKSKLKKEFGIEPWTFEQKFGEAVLIPAGCPHQARNLTSCINVAVNFVSPESIYDSIHMTEETNVLPQDHRTNIDILEVKKMAIHTIDRIVKDLEEYESIYE